MTETKTEEIRKWLLWPILVILIAGLIIFICTYVWNKVDLEITSSSISIKKTGTNKIDDDIPELLVETSRIIFKDDSFNSIFLHKYIIRNNSYNALDEGALFYIENEGEKLPKGSIISKMIRNRKIEGEDKIVGKQMEYDDTYGYSIKLSSAVPPDCEFILVMLFDESKLEGIDPRNLKIKKIYRKYEKLSKLLSSDSKITLTYLQLSIIVSLFGLVWLGVNIIRKRYSTGMEIIDQILYFIFKKRIFLKNKEKNEL